MAQADENPDRDRRLIAAIHNDLGIAHIAQQHDADALAAFSTSAQEAQAADDRPLTVRAHINAARTELKLNHPNNARDWLDLAFDTLKDFEPSHDKAMNLSSGGTGLSATPCLDAGHERTPCAARVRRAGGSGDRGRPSRRREDALLRRWLSRSPV